MAGTMMQAIGWYVRPLVLLAALALASCTMPQASAPHSASLASAKCPLCADMVEIPPGSFIMGRDGGEPGRYDGPPHKVTIARPFLMARYDVTYAQFARFIKATGYQPATSCSVFVKTQWGFRDWANWKNPGLGRKPKPDEPVSCVSWNDAKAYIAWLSKETGKPYRLPTEAEWEYVARAGTQTPFVWGDDPDGGCAVANQFDETAKAAMSYYPWPAAKCSDGFAMVAPVGSLKPDKFGLYDIVGNVWQWLEDCYVKPYPADATDGSAVEVSGPCEMRTVRGGSWETRPSRLAVAFRGRDKPDEAFRIFGFRLAMSIDPGDAGKAAD